MSQDLKQFHFTIKNKKGDSTQFLGDGTNLVDAFKDGLENAVAHGFKRTPFEIAVAETAGEVDFL